MEEKPKSSGETLPIMKHLQILKKENRELKKQLKEKEEGYRRLTEMYESTLEVLKHLQKRTRND